MTMYFDPGLIQPVDLTEHRKQELACVMADAHRHLKRAAKRHNTDIRSLRSDWRTGLCDFKTDWHFKTDWQARDSMQNLERIEHEVIAGYIRMAHSLCEAFYYAHSRCSPGISVDDFVQEAACAIFNAMYTYDGSTEFSTYCYGAIKNQLVDFIRHDRVFSKIGRNVILWRMSIIRLMNNHPELEFDQALELYKAQRAEKNLRPLTEIETSNIKAAYRTTNMVRDDILGETLFVVHDEHDGSSDSVNRVRVAVNSDLLTEDEMLMVEEFLAGDAGWQTRLAAQVGVTRAAINQRWKRTKEKLREVLERAA